MRPLAGALLALLVSCSGPAREPRPGPSPRLRLYEKGRTQALHGPDGRLQRLAYDRDGDRMAEAVVFYRPDGTPERAELDSDDDGTVDRWESFDGQGRLVKWGRARAAAGTPDEWDYPDAEGRLGRRERDRDGDGRPDHATTYRDGAAVGEEVDADGDGIWEPVGRPPGASGRRAR